MCVFAFLVFIKGGHKALIPDAIGFVIQDKAYSDESVVKVMSFLDKQAEIIGTIPLDLIQGVIYINDGNTI